MKKINVVVWAAVLVVSMLAGCGACEGSDDPCDYSASEDNLTDDERDEWCGDEVGYEQPGPGAADDWHYNNVVDEVPTRDEPVIERERTFAIALAEFEEAERGRTECVAKRPLGFTGQVCETIDDLLGDLRDLEKEFPGRTKEIAPVVAWLKGDKMRDLQEQAAEFEQRLKEEQFVITTNYGRLEAEHKIPAKLHVPRCGLDVRDFEKYAELLLAMKALGMEVASNRLRLVYQQIGWQYEWPIICEGDPKPDYEAAYKVYLLTGSEEDQQRVAGKQWRELVDGVCWEMFYENPDTGDVHDGEPGCNPAELDDPETQQWLKRARIPEAGQREAIVAEAREAEQFGLPCDAIDLASRVGDLERVRLLQQEHPRCVIAPVAPGGK